MRAIVLVLLLVGCKSKTEKALDEHRPLLAKKVAAIEALAKITLPKPEERITPPAPLVRVKDGANNNLIVVPAERLAHLTEPPGHPLIVPSDYYSALSYLDPKRDIRGLQAADVARDAAKFEGIEYVLVVKANSFEEPDLVLHGGKNGADAFKQGSFHGEAHLYGLDGKRYGGFSFAASSSFAVTYTSTGQGDIGSQIGAISQDFHAKILEVLDAALAKSGVKTN